MKLVIQIFCRYMLMLTVLLVSFSSQSQSAVQLINENSVTRLTEHIKILRETDSVLTIDQVRKRKDEFIWHTSNSPNYSISESGLWLHTTISNVTNTEEWVIDLGFSHLQKADFYLLSGNNLLASNRQGKSRFEQLTRYPTIKVDLPYATTLDLFVRIESSNTSLIAPIDIQTYQKYIRMSFWDNLLWGLFYGGLLILAVYNLVLYFGSKEPSLVAYAGYIAAVLIWQFVWGGHLTMLFPGGITPWLNQHMDLIFVLIGIASGFFTYTFLNVNVTAPKTRTFITTNMVLLALMGFVSLLNLFPPLWQNAMVYLVSLSAIISYLVAGFESYFNHFRPARYFIFAWTILAVCALIGMLSLVDIFPTNIFTTYCFQVGVFLEAGLFSLALMDKNRSQLENDIQQATNDLRNNMEFIEEQNARLDIARKDAINASHIKSQFLANMSHEIRTPLNAILGFSKELLKIPLPTDKHEHVRIINSAADSLLGIVNDVLDVSKIEAGKLHINNQPFSPNDVLEEMVSVMAKSAHQKNLEFIFDLSPLPEKLIGDAQRIKQILTNLLGNALKFTASGHIIVTASGEMLEHDIYELQIEVEDTGIGISADDRKKLFSAFSQIDDAMSRNYQGTGLGLVICKQLINLMAGKILLTSTPGRGSCFTVTLRTNLLSKIDSFARNRDWQDQQVGLLNPDPLSLRTSANMLERLGARVRTAQNLDELDTIGCDIDTLFVALPINFSSLHQHFLKTVFAKPYKQLVLLYSGKEPSIQADNFRGKILGTLRLPLTLNKLQTLTESPKEIATSGYQEGLMQLPSAKILAVDDMEMNLRLLRTWLQPSPLELTLAFTGEDAVRLCEENEYDLILMDVQMPNMDGLQASRLIRQTRLNMGTPIIAVTAHALKEEQDRLLASGMDDYLPKPLDLADLIELIRRWCEQQDHVPVNIPSVDWQLALKRANHNTDAAKEVLCAFVEQLPGMIEQAEINWQTRNQEKLNATIHKLHGACCYTGVPNLRAICDEIEGATKRKDNEMVDKRMPGLIKESRNVIEQSKQYCQ